MGRCKQRSSLPRRSPEGWLPILCFLAFILLVLGWAHIEQFMNTPASRHGETRLVVVPLGASFQAVAQGLYRQGLVTDPWRLILWARIKGLSRRIQAGEYQLSTGMSPRQILETLIKGRVRYVRVTIPEGYTMAAIARLLEQKKITQAKAFLELARDPGYVSSLGLEGPTLEGYLFPDTYRFRTYMEPARVAEMMVSRWRQVLEPFQERLQELGLSVKEVMTLASMVEKETSLAREKPLVASVFFNRLKLNMRLECDPTVIYGLKNFDGNLTRRHLRMDTPYNTYTRPGLPPGPIANPGLDSIKAVLYPASSNYLFFVSKNDGSHFFSRTFSAHLRAVRKYQRRHRE